MPIISYIVVGIWVGFGLSIVLPMRIRNQMQEVRLSVGYLLEAPLPYEDESLHWHT